MSAHHIEFTVAEDCNIIMIDEFYKYKSRRKLVSEYYELVGNYIFKKEQGDYTSGNKLQEDAENLALDLARLDKTEEQGDFIQEAHLRFLARCRLINIGDYTIQSFIGAGQCGAVYRGKRNSDKQSTAIKLLFYPRNKEERVRFIREGNITHELEHDVLVDGIEPTKTVHGAPIYWYAMELIDSSQSLTEILQSSDLSNILHIMSEVCKGLDYLHDKGHVHRDLHDGNIHVLNESTVKILDFGTVTSTERDYTFRPLGSLKVCSPEKLMEPSSVGPATDMFSVGCILHYAVSSRWPFYGDNFGEKFSLLRECNLGSLNVDSPQLEKLIASLLSKEPSSRPLADETGKQLSQISRNV